ncbi:MAG: hypothetical protein FWD57_06375 [Polyangiaceae bacterium]|nr:hypothetical protein [Polyangiaceae bacterium]
MLEKETGLRSNMAILAEFWLGAVKCGTDGLAGRWIACFFGAMALLVFAGGLGVGILIVCS